MASTSQGAHDSQRDTYIIYKLLSHKKTWAAQPLVNFSSWEPLLQLKIKSPSELFFKFPGFAIVAQWVRLWSAIKLHFLTPFKWPTYRGPILKEEKKCDKRISKLGSKIHPRFFEVWRILNERETIYWQLSIQIFIWKL
jgi:hypothetical protein